MHAATVGGSRSVSLVRPKSVEQNKGISGSQTIRSLFFQACQRVSNAVKSGNAAKVAGATFVLYQFLKNIPQAAAENFVWDFENTAERFVAPI